MKKSKNVSRKLPPIHPGEILREDYMKPMDLTAHRLAMALHVPATRIAEIIHERRSITEQSALEDILGLPPVSGSTCRPLTILRSLKTANWPGLKAKSGR